MAALISDVRSPFVAGPATRPPDAARYQSDLGDTAYESYSGNGINAYGRQGTFDILTDGEDDQGLRVTIERGTNRIADETNGFVVTVTEGAALDVTMVSADGTVDIVLAAATTMAQLKAAVDAYSGLDSDYFGGETGTGATAAQDVPPVSTATRDRAAIVRVWADNDLLIFVGASAPANDNGSELLRGGEPSYRQIPPGQLCWLKRRGNNDVPGSVAIWRAPHEVEL